MIGQIITIALIIIFIVGLLIFIFIQYRNIVREAKNYERGLKMVPLYIHIPPSSDDLEGNGRDERDVTEEVLSEAQVMYNVISSTATKGFKTKVYGQRHISFEIIAHQGLIHYYAVVPTVLVDVIRQAVIAAYPSARLEEVEEKNIFSVAIIPHTYENTNLLNLKVGDIVNIETDVFAKYVEKILSTDNNKSEISEKFLKENGFY